MTTSKTINTQSPIVLFDGVCNLCDGFVQFVIKRDKKGIIKYASLQSELGQQLLAENGLIAEGFDSVVLLNKGKAYTHSDVALQLSRIVGNGWQLFYPLTFIPRVIRDYIYNWIARNRYRWFGKKNECMIPTPEVRGRFLDW